MISWHQKIKEESYFIVLENYNTVVSQITLGIYLMKNTTLPRSKVSHSLQIVRDQFN